MQDVKRPKKIVKRAVQMHHPPRMCGACQNHSLRRRRRANINVCGGKEPRLPWWLFLLYDYIIVWNRDANNTAVVSEEASGKQLPSATNSRDASMDEYLAPFAQVEHLSACLEEKKDKLKDEKKNALI
jgi:hypothetical protein